MHNYRRAKRFAGQAWNTTDRVLSVMDRGAALAVLSGAVHAGPMAVMNTSGVYWAEQRQGEVEPRSPNLPLPSGPEARSESVAWGRRPTPSRVLGGG